MWQEVQACQQEEGDMNSPRTKACSGGILDPSTTAYLLCLSGADLGTKEGMEPFKV